MIFWILIQSYKKVLSEFNPDVIYSFLGEMNLFSLWCKPKSSKIIWGIRDSNKDIKKLETISKAIFFVQKVLSNRVDRVIFNSFAGLKFYKEYGFCIDKAVVIHNGIDIDKFKRSIEYQKDFREKNTLNHKDIAIGIVARINHIKGYIIFTKAIKKLLEEFDNIKVFAIGDGDKEIKKECVRDFGVD